ncbi:MAG TPA: hypothetical protein VLL76_04905, partial [Candidatus Omnitrophota bacterium]|nr:hypothetical protein [Candidatus Omnitrophota bacterium]
GPAMLDRKRRRKLGAAEFARLAALTAVPRAVLLAEIGWARIVAGIVLYAVLLLLHEPVIGANPWP